MREIESKVWDKKEKIIVKVELIKAKVDLIVLEQEYAPWIDKEEVERIKKEIDEAIKEINNEKSNDCKKTEKEKKQ